VIDNMIFYVMHVADVRDIRSRLRDPVHGT